MKKLLFILLLLVSATTYSQTYYISTEGACISKFSTKETVECSDEYATLIELDSNGKVLKQTNNEMSSNYYIKDKEVKDNVLWLYVISDAGNEYIMAYDKYSAVFHCINAKQDYYWSYKIKSTWSK